MKKRDQKCIGQLENLLTLVTKETVRQYQIIIKADADEQPAPVYLEALLANIFLFDYITNAFQVSEEFRQAFLESQFNPIEQKYRYLIQTADSLKTIENRFNKYAEIPMHYEENWFDQFVNNLDQNLNGSQAKRGVADDYEGIFIPDPTRLKHMHEQQEHLFEILQTALPLVVNKGLKAEKSWNKAAPAAQQVEVPRNALISIFTRLFGND